MPVLSNTADPVRGALAGLAAGLVASLVMNQFQALAQKVMPPNDREEESEPATGKAADAVAIAATGNPVPELRKPAAGNFVHYAFGAALGVGYGIAAEYRREITIGYGTGYGLAVAGIADEAAVPALGLGPPATETPPATHLYAAVSHMVFGATLEGVRGLLRAKL